MRGRTIKIHLTKGTPNDVMMAEIIASWTGQVILAPRTGLAELAKRPEVQRSGVYILVGDDPNNPGREQVYVGESDNVLTRLKQHNNDAAKNFWDRSVIVVSKDEHLTKSLIRYLESCLIQIISQAQRATLENSKTPECPKLPESDIADMDYFLEQIQMLLPVLGFTFVLPIPDGQMLPTIPTPGSTSTQSQNPSYSPIFGMSVLGASAKAQEIAGEFVVLEGSTARDENLKALSRGYIEFRKQLTEASKLIPLDRKLGLWIFKKNVPFRSSSAAASVVAGSNRNGPVTWLDEIKKDTYKNWQQARIDSLSVDTSDLASS